MAHSPIPDAVFRSVAEDNGWVGRATARALGLTWGLAVSDRLRRLKAAAALPVVQAPPEDALPVETLWQRRGEDFDVRAAHEDARRLIPITLPDDKPIGIHVFGDPHIDDPGTNTRLLLEHSALIRRTPGLYAATSGDITNNWVGRLARLYANQETRASDAWRLAEDFIRVRVGPRKWLWLTKGNHDLWSGAGDPLDWICARAGALAQDSETRIALRFPNGREVRVNTRHDFPGRSMYAAEHGPARGLIFGTRDDVALCGHTHESGYRVLLDPDTRITMHAIRVATYKVHDSFSREMGLPFRNISPCALLVIDPGLPATHPDRVHLFWDPHRGAEYLTTLRRAHRTAA